MKLIAVFSIISVFAMVEPFRFVLNRWSRVGGDRSSIEYITKHDTDLFLVRDKKFEWFCPTNENKPFHERFIQKHIQRISVTEKTFLLTTSSSNPEFVSETTLFAKGNRGTVGWRDITMYENIVEDQDGGNILRVNYHGDLYYGKPDNIQTIRLMSSLNRTYSAITNDNKYLWCALEQNTKQGKATRIDCYTLDNFQIAFTFFIKSPNCAHPEHICAVVQDCFPKPALYVVVSYRKGGIYAGHVHFPPENENSTITNYKHLPNDNYIKSIALDYPYLYTLDDHGIEGYRYPAILSFPQYIGRHKMYFSPFQMTTQIVAMKRKVFWNGQDVLHSLEVKGDS